MTNRHFLSAIILLVVLASCKLQQKEATQDNLRLWYNHPADATVKDKPYNWTDDPEWLKALPLGMDRWV